jgi:hypothetical protein
MWGKREWAIFFLSFLLFALFTNVKATSPNDASRIAAIQSIVEHSTFAIEKSPYAATMDRVQTNDHLYSDKPAFSYLVGVPIYYVLHNLGYGMKDDHAISYYFIVLFTMGLSVSVMLVCFYRFLKRYKLADGQRLFLTGALGFGTLLMPYTRVLNNHANAAAIIFIGYYFLVTAKKPGHYAAAGLLGGFAATLDLAAAPAFLVFFTFLTLLKQPFSRTAIYASSAAIPIVIYLGINYTISGSIMPFSINAQLFDYPNSPFPGGAGLSGLAKPTLEAMLRYAWDIAFGWRGIFAYMPVLLFSAFGLFFAAFQRNKFRHEALAVLFALTVTFLFYAMKTDNYGGCSFGFRFLVPIIPMLFAFTPHFFMQKQAGMELRFLFLIAVLFSVFVAFIGLIQNAWTCDLEMIPKIGSGEVVAQLYNASILPKIF